jgi:hypothetical protein
LIELKPGTTLAGSVTVEADAEVVGSSFARFGVLVAANQLEAVEKAKRQLIDEAIHLKIQGDWDGDKKSVNVKTLTLASVFATAEGKGGVSLAAPMTVKESSLQLKADLEKLGAKLGLFMADAPGLEGTVSANASYAGDKYVLDAQVKGVKIVSKGRPSARSTRPWSPEGHVLDGEGRRVPDRDGRRHVERRGPEPFGRDPQGRWRRRAKGRSSWTPSRGPSSCRSGCRI